MANPNSVNKMIVLREKDVLRTMVARQSTAQMAYEMKVEVSTIRTM